MQALSGMTQIHRFGVYPPKNIRILSRYQESSARSWSTCSFEVITHQTPNVLYTTDIK